MKKERTVKDNVTDETHITKRTVGANNKNHRDGACSNNNSMDEGCTPKNTIDGKSDMTNLIQEVFEPSEASIFVPVISVRLISFVLWTASILYATYHVFLACEEHLDEWFKDPVMNPSPFSGLFGRGKDATDYEWEAFSYIYVTRLWLWYGLYAVMCSIVRPVLHQEWNLISLGVSVVMFWELVGFLPTVFMLLQPFLYWLIAKTRSRKLAWAATIIFIFNLNSPFTKIFIPTTSFSEYFFVITSAWNYARCISFCYDVWDIAGEQPIGLKYLKNVTCYCFYLPLSVSGPLVTYDSFEKNVINRDISALKSRNLSEDFIILLKKLGRIFLIAVMNELILHFLYFRSLSLTTSVHQQLSLWAICGTIYWLGQFFSMKYKVLYGVPTAIAEFDGMEMPSLPACPSYMHRYSALWREFDNGLYRFMVRYIYVPSLKYIQTIDKSNKIPSDIQKLMASFVTYVYVYIWHSLSFEVFVWTALNFLGITIERIGSVIKREVDKRMTIEPIHWDFVIEPIVTVPLAAMSILNSSIFCGSMEAAASFSSVLWKRRQESWIPLILYFFTHTAVTHRTWRHKLYQLFSKIKKD